MKANSRVLAKREWACSMRISATLAPENYRDLTVERGCSQAASQRWLADTLTAALLPPRAP